MVHPVSIGRRSYFSLSRGRFNFERTGLAIERIIALWHRDCFVRSSVRNRLCHAACDPVLPTIKEEKQRLVNLHALHDGFEARSLRQIDAQSISVDENRCPLDGN